MPTGLDAKLYTGDVLLDGTTNTPGTVTWTEITNVRDATLNNETGEADVSTRASDFRATEPTLKDASIDFEMVWKTGDPEFTKIKNAWENRSKISVLVFDGPTPPPSGVTHQGLAMNAYVTNFTRNEPLEDALTVSVSLRNGDEFAEWYEETTP